MNNFKLLVLIMLMGTSETLRFKEEQLAHPRVLAAYRDANQALLPELQRATGEKGFDLYVRAFKSEQIVEVWIKTAGKNQYEAFRTYNFCATSGTLGPKRQEGDLQIPEGFYSIRHFNPVSNFYLSLGINYPNRSDQLRGHPVSPGSAIYIHGGCATIGCIPITDEKIKELYVIAVEARARGQQHIPVHIFPMRLNKATDAASPHCDFWNELMPVYHYFQQHHNLPQITIDKNGTYVIK